MYLNCKKSDDDTSSTGNPVIIKSKTEKASSLEKQNSYKENNEIVTGYSLKKQYSTNISKVSVMTKKEKQKNEELEPSSERNVKSSFKEKKLHIFDKPSYGYIIMNSNNGVLVKEIIKKRLSWKECTSSVTSMFNLKWQETKLGMDFAKLGKIASFKQVNLLFIYKLDA